MTEVSTRLLYSSSWETPSRNLRKIWFTFKALLMLGLGQQGVYCMINFTPNGLIPTPVITVNSLLPPWLFTSYAFEMFTVSPCSATYPMIPFPHATCTSLELSVLEDGLTVVPECTSKNLDTRVLLCAGPSTRKSEHLSASTRMHTLIRIL